MGREDVNSAKEEVEAEERRGEERSDSELIFKEGKERLGLNGPNFVRKENRKRYGP